MNIIVCIDDTDNLESPGTGHLAADLKGDIEQLWGGKTSLISRHQLFVSPEVPYTSHNSSMCFRAALSLEYLDEMITYAGEFLERRGAEGSDPGLCVAVPEKLKNYEDLVDFGRDATCRVLTKKNAWSLAADLDVHLSEHGGTGDGIIGALAGVGLRLYGNNGRFKGWHDIPDERRRIHASELCQDYDIDEIRNLEGEKLADDAKLLLKDKIKTVLLDHKSVLLVHRVPEEKGFIWQNISKEEIKKY